MRAVFLACVLLAVVNVAAGTSQLVMQTMPPLPTGCDVLPTVQNPEMNRFNLGVLASAGPFVVSDTTYNETYKISFCSGTGLVETGAAWGGSQTLYYKTNGLALNRGNCWGSGASPSSNGGLACYLKDNAGRDAAQIVLLCDPSGGLFSVPVSQIYRSGTYRGLKIYSSAGCSANYFQGCYSQPEIQNPNKIRYDFAPLAINGPFTYTNPTGKEVYTFSFCGGKGFDAHTQDGESWSAYFINTGNPLNPMSAWGAGSTQGGIAFRLVAGGSSCGDLVQIVINCAPTAGLFDVVSMEAASTWKWRSFIVNSPVGCGVDA